MNPSSAFLRFALLSLVLSILCGAAQAQGVLVDKSEIRFIAKQLGVTVEGKFRRFKPNVVLNPKAIATSKADIEIDLASIDLASDESEKEVKSQPWFDTAKFPAARFTSTAIRDLGGGKYEVAGKLSIKGITRDLVVPITLTRDAAGNRIAQGTFVVKRLDYKLGEGMWADTDTVADPVTVQVRMVLPPD